MNIQGNVRHTKSGRTRSEGSFWSNLAVAFHALLFIGVLGAIASACVYLNQKIERVEREIAATSKAIHLCEREIENLRNTSENLKSWSHIGPKITAFRLGLRANAPGQVRRMAWVEPGFPRERSAVRVASRR